MINDNDVNKIAKMLTDDPDIFEEVETTDEIEEKGEIAAPTKTEPKPKTTPATPAPTKPDPFRPTKPAVLPKRKAYGGY